MSEAANRDASNLIPLCETHAWEIDQTPQHFTADMLREWKKKQLAEYQSVQRSWTLTDAEVTDVVTVSFATLEERLLGGIHAAAEFARQEERRQRQRALIADMIHAADSWTDTMQILTIGSARSGWKTRDIIEWVNTDSGREMARNREIIKSNARKLRFETRHPGLLAALDAAETAMGDLEVYEPVWSGSTTSAEERTVVYRHLNHVKRLFLDLESIGINVLADPPPEDTP